MRLLPSLVIAGALSVLFPAPSHAQGPWTSGRSLPYDQGFERGQRAGADDARRGDRYDFTDESDYRRADAGYRSQHGDRQRYREIFRSGFEAGYRSAYGPGYGGRTPDGYGGGHGDPAFERGYNDGYEAGLDDGRHRRRADPIAESRYRSADRGYSRIYGSRDAYKNRYRVAFRQGYERGYADARRYDRRDRGWGSLFGFGR